MKPRAKQEAVALPTSIDGISVGDFVFIGQFDGIYKVEGFLRGADGCICLSVAFPSSKCRRVPRAPEAK